MYIIDRSIGLSLFQLCGGALVVFTLLWIAPESLLETIQAGMAGQLTVVEGLQLLALQVPVVLLQAIPMSAMVGSLFVIRRLTVDFEWIAAQAAGLSQWRLLRPFLVVGCLLALLLVSLQEWVIPASEPYRQALQVELGLTERKPNYFVYLERANGHLSKFWLLANETGLLNHTQLSSSDALVLYYGANGQTIRRILQSNGAEWDGEHWQLSSGTEYELDEEGVYRQPHPFDHQTVSAPPGLPALMQVSAQPVKTMPLSSLVHYIRLLEEAQQEQNLGYAQMALHERWSRPLACIVLVLLGAWLGQEPPRARRSWGLTLGAAALFVYLISLPFTLQLGGLSLIPAWLAALLPLLLCVLVGWLVKQLLIPTLMKALTA